MRLKLLSYNILFTGTIVISSLVPLSAPKSIEIYSIFSKRLFAPIKTSGSWPSASILSSLILPKLKLSSLEVSISMKLFSPK